MNNKPTLVIADDEELTRHFLSATLSSQGFNVLLAEDGSQALDLVNGNEVTLIISDIHMPKMSGTALVEKLKQSNHKNIPVILITADGESFDQQQAAGATILRKPFRRRELVELINSVLGRQSA